MLAFQIALTALAIAPVVPAGQPADLLKPGQTLFAARFDGADTLKGWHGAGAVVASDAGHRVLRIESAGAHGSTVSRSLPVEGVRGWAGVEVAATLPVRTVEQETRIRSLRRTEQFHDFGME